jgi:hypothetical protein
VTIRASECADERSGIASFKRPGSAVRCAGPLFVCTMHSSRRAAFLRNALGGRSTVGHVALDHVIGVRIPASQPTSLALAIIARSLAARHVFRHLATRMLVANRHESLPPSQLRSLLADATDPATRLRPTGFIRTARSPRRNSLLSVRADQTLFVRRHWRGGRWPRRSPWDGDFQGES